MILNILANFSYFRHYFLSIKSKCMILNKFYNSFRKSCITPQIRHVHGINPKLFYKNGNYLCLPRFSSIEMEEARSMNKIALNNMGAFYDKSFKNALSSDYLVLKDDSYEASFSRVRWVNPKDNNEYFLLKDGEPINNEQNIRILDSTGRFIKNAKIKKKTIIVFELDSDDKFKDLNNASHSDLTSIFIRRFNPFANIKVCLWKDKLDIDNTLGKLLDENVAAISCDFSSNVLINQQSKLMKLYNKIFHKKLKVNPEDLADKLFNMLDFDEKQFDKIPSNVRIFMASGNDGVDSYNKYLSLRRIEGVGSLNDKKKISDFSASRNSYFTQHYEKGEYPVVQLPEGFMFTGTGDIDIPCKTDKFRLISDLDGSSFAVSVRAAKVVLNQMMEGIL